MATQVCLLWFLLAELLVTPPVEVSPAQPIKESTYGDAEISQVIEITSEFTLICDIRNYPPVIGHRMPVRIRGLESPQSIPDPGLRDFLDHLFGGGHPDPNQVILLKNIQRGEQFCLIADIEVDGRDLGDHLVEQGLVKRILKVPLSPEAAKDQETAVLPEPPAAPKPAQSVSKPTPSNPPQARGYVSSKSSRIFHRADCPHAKRITEEKKVYFHSREQAAAGRRPCKACNP
jgi:micrococcal nuclease